MSLGFEILVPIFVVVGFFIGLLCAVNALMRAEERAIRRDWPKTEAAAIWRRFGFTDNESRLWSTAGFSPPCAERWMKAGISTPASALTWQRLVGSPDRVPAEDAADG